MAIELNPIGTLKCNLKSKEETPKHFSISQEEGIIEVFPEFAEGLYRIEECQYLIVTFHFHKSKKDGELRQYNPSGEYKGVFALCSPNRPNPIGISILKLLKVEENRLFVRGIDMLDGTPIMDIKPCKLYTMEITGKGEPAGMLF